MLGADVLGGVIVRRGEGDTTVRVGPGKTFQLINRQTSPPIIQKTNQTAIGRFRRTWSSCPARQPWPSAWAVQPTNPTSLAIISIRQRIQQLAIERSQQCPLYFPHDLSYEDSRWDGEKKNKSTNQPTNQPTNRPTNQSNQSNYCLN